MVGLFRPTTWQLATKENFPELEMHLPKRRAFTGVEANESVRRRHLGGRLPTGLRFSGTDMNYARHAGRADVRRNEWVAVTGR